MAVEVPYIEIIPVFDLYETFAKEAGLSYCKVGDKVDLEKLSGPLEQSPRQLLLDVSLNRGEDTFVYSGASLVLSDLVIMELSAFLDTKRPSRGFRRVLKPEHVAFRRDSVRGACELNEC